MFIGAGRRALSYSLSDKVKLSDRSLAVGFWYWYKHDKYVILAEELEIAVYRSDGRFIWEARTEPPWSYGIEGNILSLDIMDNITKYKLDTGSPIE